jgi:hypothetical protein
VKPSKAEPELEEIPEAECVEILGQHNLGRVAIVVEGRAQIFPVNYGLRDKIIAFRTAAGTKLSHAPGSHVAFEIDGYDEATGVGWSVVVQGIGRDVTDAGDDFSWMARGIPTGWPSSRSASRGGVSGSKTDRAATFSTGESAAVFDRSSSSPPRLMIPSAASILSWLTSIPTWDSTARRSSTARLMSPLASVVQPHSDAAIEAVLS